MNHKLNIIDVGAVRGFDPPWSSHQDKIGKSLSFEPNEPSVLTGDHLRYDTAIWNIDGEATFYVAGPDGVGSSLLKQNVNWVRENFDRIKTQGDERQNARWFDVAVIHREFPCRVKKIDTVLREIRASLGEDLHFHFLKSDTQSGEFYVLQGAEEFIDTDCLGLELELYRYPLYEGIVTEDEVIDYLAAKGFEIAGWTGYMNSFLSQADYLFLRKEARNETESHLLGMMKEIYRPQGKSKLIKQLGLGTRCLHSLYRIKQRLLGRI